MEDWKSSGMKSFVPFRVTLRLAPYIRLSLAQGGSTLRSVVSERGLRLVSLAQVES